MSTQDPKPPFTRSDILAIFMPGFYILTTVVFVVGIFCHDGDTEKAWRSWEASNAWIVILVLTLLGFLFGSMIRAVSVSLADDIAARLFGWMARAELHKLLYQKPFPYRPYLDATLKDLQKNGIATQEKLPEAGTAHTMYNLWKVELSEGAPNAFAYTQDLEYRTRLFAGMFWAGAWGVAVTVIGIAGCAIRFQLASQWLAPLFGQLAVSSLFFLVFGWALRRVRGQEVCYLFLAHVLAKKTP